MENTEHLSTEQKQVEHTKKTISVFISYSHQDEAFAKYLYETLAKCKDVYCWYAPEDIQGGKKLHEQIDEAIRTHDKLLLVLSEHSIHSEWVKTEIAHARQREVTQNKRMLFPIRLVDFESIKNWTCFDTDAGKDSAREIREYFIPDFSNWKDHDAFEKAFARLLRDLEASVSPGDQGANKFPFQSGKWWRKNRTMIPAIISAAVLVLGTFILITPSVSFEIKKDQHPQGAQTFKLNGPVMPPGDCQIQCAQDPNCTVYVYSKYEGCYLKTGEITGWEPWQGEGFAGVKVRKWFNYRKFMAK